MGNLNTFTQSLYAADMNIISFIILLFMYFKLMKKTENNSLYAGYLKATTVAVLCALVLEAISYVTTRTLNTKLIPLSVFVLTIQLQLPLICCYLYWNFLHNYITKDVPMKPITKLILALPVIITGFFIFTNPFTGFSFILDEQGIYTRGSLNTIIVVLTVIYFASISIEIFLSRKKLTKSELIILNLFLLFPFLGGILQTFFYGILLLWTMSAFALMIVFLYLDNKISKLDSLTGAYSRSTLEKYLDGLTKNSNFGLAFIDLDDFKSINDKFGHSEGDNALSTFSTLVKSCLDKEDILARYGGDEFVICFNNKSLKEISASIHTIDLTIFKFNEKKKLPYPIKFSCGFDVFNIEKYYNPNHLLRTIDTQMYEKKLNKKLLEYTNVQKQLASGKTKVEKEEKKDYLQTRKEEIEKRKKELRKQLEENLTLTLNDLNNETKDIPDTEEKNNTKTKKNVKKTK